MTSKAGDFIGDIDAMLSDSKQKSDQISSKKTETLSAVSGKFSNFIV